MTSITVEATKPLGVKPRDAERSKNFFALGLDLLDVRPPDRAAHRVDQEAVREPHRRCSRRTSPRSGPASTSARPPSCSTTPYEVKPAQLAPGTYRNITGNVALSYGLVAAAQKAKLPIVLRVVPDHARVRHPARAVEAEELRREDAAGRRRDRRRGCRGRRRVRRQPRGHRRRAVPVSTSRPRRSGSRSASSCRW